MDRKMLAETFGWGFALWLIGYVLGFVFFFMVPPAIVGWFIMPIGIAMAVFVSISKVDRRTLLDYVPVALAWTVMAIALDYIFIVKMLNPPDGYYKLDVYLYYALTFAIPMAAGYWKQKTGRGRAGGKSGQ